MLNIHTFDEARVALEPYYMPQRPQNYVYTLDGMRELLAFVGNPQDAVQVIHVAGTSGKTSTAYYMAALLHAAGQKVGTSVSPHVIELNDRVQINGKPLAERPFCKALTEYLKLVEQSGLRPTYFELMLSFAFWEFRRQAVDVAVIEVGVGGLLDPSNTVMRADKLCVITDIGYDHMQVLGSKIEEITAQKAGIIQLHNTVFCMQQERVVIDIFKATAQQKQADLHVIAQADDTTLDELPLFQRRNFQLARAAVMFLLERQGKLLTDVMQKKAMRVAIPGRMEIFRAKGKIIIVDGSHNEQKLTSLMASVAKEYPGQRPLLVMAFGQQPEALARIENGLAAVRPYADEIIATQFGGADDAPHYGVESSIIAAVAKICGFQHVHSVPNPERAFEQAIASPHELIVIAGSFYLLNHMRPLAQAFAA